MKFCKDISGHLNGLDIPPGCKSICAGDWNLIFDTRMDSQSKLERKSIYQLNSIMSSYYLIDIWRIRNPALRQFIWRRKIPRQMSTKSVRGSIRAVELNTRFSAAHTQFKDSKP